MKETSSLLRFHFQRRSLSCRSKLIQVARRPLGLPPRFGCPLVWLSSFGLSFGHGEAKEWRLSVFKVFCMSNVSEFVSSHIKTLELRKNSNSTANAFVTVTYSYEMESEFLRSFFPTRARRCHFCMGISHKSRDLDRIMD